MNKTADQPASAQVESQRRREKIRHALTEHESALVRYARHFVKDLELARDVVQDTFLKLCRQDLIPGDGEEHDGDRLAAWLYRVCRNRAIDVSRKEGRMKSATPASLETTQDTGTTPGDSAVHKETVQRVARQVSELPERQQEILKLKFEGGLTYAEIADVTGLTSTNVGFILHTAISKLRSRAREL
ncbi:MAG: sigma-70 family RNA polymerase sigma factor [Planctomycetota bacterium]